MKKTELGSPVGQGLFLNKDEALCFHCRLPMPPQTTFSFDQKEFCCHGCLSVYKMISGSGLNKFYEMNVADDPGQRLEHYNPSLNFAHFDVGAEKEKVFYLEGVHCLACLWLIENSKNHIPGIESIRLNMASSQATIRINDSGSFSELGRWLNKLGYYPHLIKDNLEAEKLRKLENYTMLKRIGVAAFSTGNIMWFAVSIYSGADGTFLPLFSWVSGLLFFPTLVYSAQPFFKNAYYKIRAGQLALDIPVAITIFLGALVSYINLFRGSLHFYFDSLAAFVFLLLSARFFLKRIQQEHASTQHVQDLFESSECLKKVANEYRRVGMKDIKVNDQICLHQGETVPLDLELLVDRVCVNTALISGEHLPRLVEKGEKIYAGSVVMSGVVEGRVLGLLKDSQLGKILNSVEASWLESNTEVQLADRLANYLLGFAFVLCAGLVAYFGSMGQWELGMERAMAVLIVTCPCALGLGVPLAYIHGLKSLFKKKIVVKSGEILKRISEVRNIYFDKTGTITKGAYSVVGASGNLSKEDASKIWLLERYSTHPIAFGLRRYLEEKYKIDFQLEVKNFKEELGVGVDGFVGSEHWQIMKSRSQDSDVEVFCNGEKKADFSFDDPLKEESSRVLQWFRRHHINCYLLTGDHLENADKVSSKLGSPFEKLFADQLPENKAQVLKNTKNNLMVGDGYNDVIAFESAGVGVAMGQKVDLQLKNADVFIPSGRLDELLLLFKGAFKTQTILRRNIAFSVFYNLGGIVGSVLGVISPLAAAVLMPLSSITILLSTVWGRDRR